MNNHKFILVDEEFLKNLSDNLIEIKRLLAENSLNQARPHSDELMTTKDLTIYLKIDRKTIYNYRRNGLPDVKKMNGKLYYWRSEVEKYFGKVNSQEQLISNLGGDDHREGK